MKSFQLPSCNLFCFVLFVHLLLCILLFWGHSEIQNCKFDGLLHSQVTSLANYEDFSAESGLLKVTSSNEYLGKYTNKLFSFFITF